MAVTLSDSAAERVRRFLDTRGAAVGLRFGVKRTGCSGWAYVVDLADEIADDDRIYESNGVKIVIDAKSLPLVDGTRIDFGREGLNESFLYENPNVKNLCGCGESFGI